MPEGTVSDINLNIYRGRLAAIRKTKGRFWTVASPGGERRGLGWWRQHIPWTRMGIILAMCLSLKAMLILTIGEPEYRAKLASYADPSPGERIGLFVMQPDIFSLRLHDMARPYLVRQDCRDITKRLRDGPAQPLC